MYSLPVLFVISCVLVENMTDLSFLCERENAAVRDDI